MSLLVFEYMSLAKVKESNRTWNKFFILFLLSQLFI